MTAPASPTRPSAGPFSRAQLLPMATRSKSSQRWLKEHFSDPFVKKAKAEGCIGYPIKDFYLTNPIARSSPTMQRCSAELLHGEDLAEAAE